MNEHKFLMIGAAAALLALVYMVKKKGAAAGVGAAVGAAAVDAVGGITTGVVTGVSQAVGIPTPAETLTNVSDCQAYRDANGWWAASFKCGLPALMGTSAAPSNTSDAQPIPAVSDIPLMM